MTAPTPGVTRVLLVDDQALLRAGFRVLIESADDLAVVGEASTGVEALDRVRAGGVDVVLMDIRMPEMDGLAATRAIVADPGLAGVKVLVLTTFELDEYVFAGVALRAPAVSSARASGRTNCWMRSGWWRAATHCSRRRPPAR